MCWKLCSRIWKYSNAKGTDLLVLLAIADYVPKDENIAFPSVSTLCRKCGVSESTVQRSLKKLQSLGELKVAQNKGKHGTNLYIVELTDSDSDIQLVISKRTDTEPSDSDLPNGLSSNGLSSHGLPTDVSHLGSSNPSTHPLTTQLGTNQNPSDTISFTGNMSGVNLKGVSICYPLNLKGGVSKRHLTGVNLTAEGCQNEGEGGVKLIPEKSILKEYLKGFLKERETGESSDCKNNDLDGNIPSVNLATDKLSRTKMVGRICLTKILPSHLNGSSASLQPSQEGIARATASKRLEILAEFNPDLARKIESQRNIESQRKLERPFEDSPRIDSTLAVH